MTASPQIDRNAIEDTAAHWVMRREEPDWSGAEQAELDAWLAESMAHKAAFWRLEYAWRQADRIGSLGETVRAPSRLAFADSWIGRNLRPMAIAASLLLVFGFAVMQLSHQPVTPRVEQAGQTIATRVGGHTVVPLDDGSRIELNTATLLRASVTEQSREVWLDKGEAYFEVKHSDTVPFVVYAGPRTVTVLGTKFLVRRDGDKVTVSVIEGRVRVDEVMPKGQAGSSSTVTTGDVAIAEGNSTLVAARSPERVESALAWRDGMLTFDQVTLGEAAVEFNRYNERKLVIADPEVARIKIGGTFRASNIDAFVRLLHDAYGLDAQVAGNEVKVTN